MNIVKVTAIPMSAPDRPGLGFPLRAAALERFRCVDALEYGF